MKRWNLKHDMSESTCTGNCIVWSKQQTPEALKKKWKQLLNAMNATLSQNVVVISYNEVPPTNITEQVQLKFKVDIHYIIYNYITYRSI